MLAAVKAAAFPRVGRIEAISPNPNCNSEVTILFMEQERAPHKPKWARYFKLSSRKDAVGIIRFSDIILYDFQLTQRGALKKKAREYLQEYYK